MRHERAVLLAACLAAGLVGLSALLTQAQDGGLQPYYWPTRTVGIPLDVDRLAKLPNKPAELQLYYSLNHGPFLKGPRLPLDKMQPLDGGKQGFLFTTERDGDFEFTVQHILPNGTVSPRTEELAPQQRVVVDTTPPAIRLTPMNNGVEWTIIDDNLDPYGIALKYKWPDSREWTVVKVKDRVLRANDSFSWQIPPGKVIEVRLEAEDRARHKSISQTV